MASKNKREPIVISKDDRPARFEVDRLIAKGWFKDAVRQAKICHRDEPTVEHHRLLEKAYLLRAQELQKNRMAAAAQEVAGQLLEFGITDPELIEPAASLLVAVGLASRALELPGKDSSAGAKEKLTRMAADQAVLRPGLASSTPSEIRESAARVRSALEALTSGDDSKAMELLKDVARTSPMADWRLFARGLAAFRRGQDADAKANWDRLDPDRAASRIARSLTDATGSLLVEGPVAPKFADLERWALGEPLFGPLRVLARSVAQGEWTEAIQQLGSIRLAIRRVDPDLAIRITETLYSPLIQEATSLPYRDGSNLIKAFIKVAEPLPIDPRWNRLWAIVWQMSDGGLQDSEPHWRKYLEDLSLSTAIRPEDRPKARAMVLARLGDHWADAADEIESDGEPEFGPPRLRNPMVPDEEAMSARRRAVAMLEQSLALFPSRRETHRSLIEVYRDGGQLERAAQACRKLLEILPDDLETLIELSRYHSDRDEQDQALELILRARKLKPLDKAILNGEWASRTALGRQLAKQGRWDEARAELATAERIVPELCQSPHFAARKAMVEKKAGRSEAAEAILDRARASLDDPTPLWLAMAIEAKRFEMPKAEIARFESLWKEAVSKKVRGATAGHLAELITPFVDDKVPYPGRDEDVRLVTNYLARTTRIKYEFDDLLAVCNFLELSGKQDVLSKKLANRGVKLFPDAPEFPLLLGMIEMQKGPMTLNPAAARKELDKALKLCLARPQTDPAVIERVAAIRKLFGALDAMSGFDPFGFGGFGGIPDDLFDAFGAGEFDTEYEFMDEPEEDDEDGPTPLPAPRTPRKKPKPAAKPKKKKR